MDTRVNINLNIPCDTTAALRKALNVLSAFDVLVGVPSDDEQGNNSAGGRTARPVGKANNALLAYVHNTGNPKRNIPARPTLLPGIHDAEAKIAQRFEDGATAALDGSVDRVEKNMMAAGQVAVDAVKNRIRSNTPPPLKAATIAARLRRGATRTNTLVDTGAYLNSHTYIVRKKVQ